MVLTTGTKLGAYEIVSVLGAGGMGQGYRARDTALGRDVALKILRPGAVQDADRLRRFRQEAQAAAALNHPNILAIHFVGEQDGAPYIYGTRDLFEEVFWARIYAGFHYRHSLEDGGALGRRVSRQLFREHFRSVAERDDVSDPDGDIGN